jgi:hypothetical protein
MTAVETDHHLTTLDLDRLVLGDLVAEDRQRVEVHAGRCARCQARRSDHETRVAYFRDAVLPRTLPLVAWHRPWKARLWALAIAAPALAVAGFVLAHHFDGQRGDHGLRPELAVKGDGQMQVYVRRATAAGAGIGAGDAVVARVANGDRLAPGDALRFVLYPSGLPYALIASVDGAGQVNVYFPFHGEASAAVDGAVAVPVAGSIVLDDAPGPERLFAIFSDRAIAARGLRELLAPMAAGGAASIRAAGRLPLPGTQQATLMFEKEIAR